MKNYELLVFDYKRKLQKAIRYLEYSYHKVIHLTEIASQLDEESLEVWESFSARFSRVIDLFLTKYLRAMVLKNDPGFEGTLRDFTNQGEKLGILDRADNWMQLRELRNISAHDYTEEDLTEFFRQIREYAPCLILLKEKLK